MKMDLFFAEYRIESSDLRRYPERNVIEAEREGKSLPIQPTYGSDPLIQLFHKRMILNSRHVEEIMPGIQAYVNVIVAICWAFHVW